MEFRLRELMKARKLTYREVEAGANVSKSILTRMNSGRQKRVDLVVIDRLLGFFDCDISDLLIRVPNQQN